MVPLPAVLDNSAYSVYTVGMKTLQYTIRNIPEPFDQALRKRARLSGKSFNQTVLDVLAVGITGSHADSLPSNFEWLFNSGGLDKEFDQAITDLSKPDKSLWL